MNYRSCPKWINCIVVLSMYLRLMSRLTLFFMCCFLFLIERGIAQQKQNDFTKRLFGVDGKMSAKSKSLFRNARTSTLSSKRIRVEDWPRYYSSYGSKKFPAYTPNTISNRRVNSKILPTELPLQDNLAEENQERALGGSLGKSAPALSTVQFRDAYYEKLDRRVDDWMDKVNNLSLRDINRFQFRKGDRLSLVSLFSEPDRKQIHLLHLLLQEFPTQLLWRVNWTKQHPTCLHFTGWIQSPLKEELFLREICLNTCFSARSPESVDLFLK